MTRSNLSSIPNMRQQASWSKPPRPSLNGKLLCKNHDFSNLLRLKERVMDMRKKKSEKPWPANDRDVGVILVAHSMGLVFSFLSILVHH